MEAIVLAGGLGMRLRELVPDLPKPMAPVAGRPFLEILLRSLAHKGFQRVILSLGYMAEKIVAHFGDNYAGLEIVYEIESTPLGTGGAIRKGFESCTLDHAFILNGDTYLDIEVLEIEALWQAKKLPIIVARSVADTSRFGRIEAAHGHVLGFVEKGLPGPGLINAGCYLLPTSILDIFPLGEAFSLEVDFLAQAISQRPFELFISHGQFIDIGVPEDFRRAQSELAEVCR